MSRSRKHTPKGGFTSSQSEAQYKRIWNRRFRFSTREALRRGEEALPYNIRKETELWDGLKDGKMGWWREPDHSDADHQAWSSYLRK